MLGDIPSLWDIFGTILVGVLIVAWFLVRNQLGAFQANELAQTKAITDLTNALAVLRAELPKEYVLKTDLLRAQQVQADEMRGVRAEVVALRTEVTAAVNGLSGQISRLLTSMAGMKVD